LIVVDASAMVGALVGPDPTVGARLSREPLLHGPQLLPLEVASALRRFAVAGRLSRRGARLALAKLAALPLTLHPHPQLMPRIWELRANLTIYDACYVAAAEALGLPLITSDARLSRAPGPRCTIEVV
jgi:predicted nucleic acid-binding protein